MQLSRRALLGATAASFALAACGRQAQSGDLNGILDRLSTDILREIPEFATSLAVSEEQAGGRYINRLSDYSKEGSIRLRTIGERALAELEALNEDRLEGQDSVTYAVVHTALKDSVDSARFEHGGGAQAPYVVTQLTGAYTSIPDFLASQHPVTNREQADAYLERLAAYARVLDQETTRIGEDAAAGVIQPNFTIAGANGRGGAVGQLRAFAATAPAQTVLVTSLQGRLNEVADIPAADKTALTQRAEQIVRDEVLPAYQRQVDALNAVLPRATSDAGVWRLPNGAEMYATALRAYTTTDMAPQELHQMGVDLIAQFTSEMDQILRAQGMTNGTVNERINALGRRPDQIFPSTTEGRAALLAMLNQQMAAITARMPEVCGVQARAALEIKAVPEYIQAGAPGGYYQVAALDGSRPGAYYINLRDPATEWPKFTLPTLTYHEGTPGHHWQLSIQQEAGEMPFIRRALLGFSGFSEGWGLYAEQLADEMGMYQNDPFGRIGYLQSMTFRASRLVVDTGIHHMRWTREQAVQSMMQATGDQETNVTTEVERYCVWPGQACSYMAGRQALNRMRDGARQTLGDRFDLRAFHDRVLTNGSTPLTVTEGLVNDWVAEVQRA
ncbi:MAG TPA: DUF885 family protein [Vitreimonas sp.]|uniref:DUF885 domain-containing protein n=1 Tax=Vitreimonas sp. TaxID=3069702 RepID=UPI002D36A9B2|nr:DUF885 family protein [Vitreimonas sp.]HYD89427.1 DUF885 family protein [Vitreimonas sp.]